MSLVNLKERKKTTKQPIPIEVNNNLDIDDKPRKGTILESAQKI